MLIIQVGFANEKITIQNQSTMQSNMSQKPEISYVFLTFSPIRIISDI